MCPEVQQVGLVIAMGLILAKWTSGIFGGRTGDEVSVGKGRHTHKAWRGLLWAWCSRGMAGAQCSRGVVFRRTVLPLVQPASLPPSESPTHHSFWKGSRINNGLKWLISTSLA